MFLKLALGAKDKDFLRFLMRLPTDPKNVYRVYRWKVVTWGLSDSPIQAMTAIHMLADMVLTDLSPRRRSGVPPKFY